MIKNKKILVTGGAGFIGSHLVERLSNNNNDVVVIDNLLRKNKINKSIKNNINFVQGDVRDLDIMITSTKNIDYVFHLAAYLGVDDVAKNPIETMEVETIGTQNLINACLKNSVKKIIYTSTSGVYGKSAIQDSVNEDYEVAPTSSYAIAKRFNEIYLKSINEKYKIETFSLRYFNVYGPRQDNRMVIPKFFEQALLNNPITVYGNGNQTRDFTFIDDTINATLLIAEKCKGNGIFNIARGTDTTMNDLANEVIKITESKSKIKHEDAPFLRFDFDVDKRCGDSSKLKKLTGYKPEINLNEGLIKTLKYIKENEKI